MSNLDPRKDLLYIVYLDFNNRYGWPLSEPISYGVFALVEDVSGFATVFTVKCDKNNSFCFRIISNVDYPDYL